MSTTSDRRRRSPRPKRLSKELGLMMYGFGDAQEPQIESVDLVEALVTRYIESICDQALGILALRGGKLDADCFLMAVSTQPAKYKRIVELLEMRENLKKARSINSFENDFPLEILAATGPEIVNNEASAARRKKISPLTTSPKETKPVPTQNDDEEDDDFAQLKLMFFQA